MPYYLAPYIGSGTRQDPFRPLGSDQPGWSAVDLRPDGGATLGGGGLNACLLYLPVADARPQLRQIGLAKADTIGPGLRNAIQTRLGVTVTATTLLDLVWDLLLAPPANTWKPIVAARSRYEVWLGPDPWVRNIIAGGLSASDDFNRANEAPLGGNWSFAAGGVNVNLTNNAVTSAGSDDFAYWNPGGFGVDQDASLTWVSGSNGDSGPACRIGAGGLTGYFLTFVQNPPICKYVTGTFSTIGGTAATPANGNIYRLTVQGSTVSAFLAGVAKGSVTDTSLDGSTTGTSGPGFFIYNTGGDTWDDWSATDVFGGGTSIVRQMLMHHGG